MSFLDNVETKVKQSKDKYTKEEYKFNNPEFEVAPGESDFSEEPERAANDSSN